MINIKSGVINLVLCTFTLFLLINLRSTIVSINDAGFIFLLITIQSYAFLSVKSGLLFQSYWVFSIFFFAVTPVIELAFEKRSYVGMPTLSDFDFIIAGMLIFVSNTIYFMAYHWSGAIRFKRKNFRSQHVPHEFSTHEYDDVKNNIVQQQDIVDKKFAVAVVVSIFCIFIVFDDLGGNLTAMFVRFYEFSENASEWGGLKLIIQRFIRPIPILFFLLYFVSHKGRYGRSFVLFLLGVVCAFPTAIPRFMAAAMYIPVLLVLVPALKYNLRYSYLLILSMLVAFPLLNSFRRLTELQATEGFHYSFLDFEFMIEGHFDSFQSFAQVVGNDIVTYGYQILGVIFFWVPRSLWLGKPYSSGMEVATQLNAVFPNISANFYAEGWLNFGFVGMVIFAVLLGLITRRLDSDAKALMDDLKINSTPSKNYDLIKYFIIVPMLFITLRGDLNTGVSNAVGFLLAWYCVKRIYRLLDRVSFNF